MRPFTLSTLGLSGPILALALPSIIEHRQNEVDIGVSMSKMDAPTSNSTSDLNAASQNLSAPRGARSFEHYLQTGVGAIARPNIPMTNLSFIEFRTFYQRASSDALDFIKMKITYQDPPPPAPEGPTSYYTYNWNTDDVAELSDWSPPAFLPNQNQFDHMRPFVLFQLHLTIAQAVERLKAEGTWGPWGGGGIGFFARKIEGHELEPFYGFQVMRAADVPARWHYVGAWTGYIAHDDPPLAVARRGIDPPLVEVE